MSGPHTLDVSEGNWAAGHIAGTSVRRAPRRGGSQGSSLPDNSRCLRSSHLLFPAQEFIPAQSSQIQTLPVQTIRRGAFGAKPARQHDYFPSSDRFVRRTTAFSSPARSCAGQSFFRTKGSTLGKAGVFIRWQTSVIWGRFSQKMPHRVHLPGVITDVEHRVLQELVVGVVGWKAGCRTLQSGIPRLEMRQRLCMHP